MPAKPTRRRACGERFLTIILDFKPHEKTNSIRTILVHQLLSERHFSLSSSAQKSRPSKNCFLPVRSLSLQAYIDKYVGLVKRRLPQLGDGNRRLVAGEPALLWRITERERIWVFWRHVLHTCHHRTQVQSWLRMAGRHVPAIYGPSGDVTWEEADPTYSLEAAKRDGK